MYCAFVFHSLSICNLRTEGKLYCVLQKKEKKLGEKKRKKLCRFSLQNEMGRWEVRWDSKMCQYNSVIKKAISFSWKLSNDEHRRRRVFDVVRQVGCRIATISLLLLSLLCICIYEIIATEQKLWGEEGLNLISMMDSRLKWGRNGAERWKKHFFIRHYRRRKTDKTLLMHWASCRAVNNLFPILHLVMLTFRAL